MLLLKVLHGRLRSSRASRRRVMVMVELMRFSQLSVFADQILHLPLELVDSLSLRLYEALLVLHNGSQFLQVQHCFHRIVQKAFHIVFLL